MIMANSTSLKYLERIPGSIGVTSTNSTIALLGGECEGRLLPLRGGYYVTWQF
jgi:hypothetical protein